MRQHSPVCTKQAIRKFKMTFLVCKNHWIFKYGLTPLLLILLLLKACILNRGSIFVLHPTKSKMQKV